MEKERVNKDIQMNNSNLAHYIDGMQSAIHLIECYNPDNSDTKEEEIE